MKGKKNIVQSKIVQTTPERGSAEIDLSSLPDKEFKIKIINNLTELQRNMQELRDDDWREIIEMKQFLEGFISRMDKIQEGIDGIETREQEHIETDVERDKRSSRN